MEPISSLSTTSYSHQYPSQDQARTPINYHDLAKQIPSVYPALPFNKSEEWHWSFCTACIEFLSMKDFDSQTLDLDEKDTIGKLVDCLIKALHSLEYFIEIEDEQIHFLSHIPSKDMNVGVALQWIKDVKEKPLQIAMAHILKQIDESIDFNLDSTIFESNNDCYESYPYNFHYYIEEGNENLTKKQRRAEVQKFKNRANKLITLMQTNAKLSLETFVCYNPRTQKNKQLKSILEKLLNYNPNRITTFGAFGDPELDTGDYRAHFSIYIDTSLDFDHSLRREQVNNMWETGFCYLAARTTFENGKFIEEHTKQDIAEFQQYEQALLELTELL